MISETGLWGPCERRSSPAPGGGAEGAQLRYKWVQSDVRFPVSMRSRMHLKCSLQLTLGQTMWALSPGDSCKEELGSSDWQTSHNSSNPKTAGYQPHRLVRFLFLPRHILLKP